MSTITLNKKKRWSNSMIDTFMLIDGVPVAYLCYFHHDDNHVVEGEEKGLALCDLEVRPEYRGKGLAKEIIRRVQESEDGKILYTSGCYTKTGYERLVRNGEGLVPMQQWRVRYGDTHHEAFKDMTFVRDWDKMIPMN